MIELVDMEQATPFDRLLLVLVGREKTGKSRLAASGRKGVLVLDWDGRRESLAGMKGVRVVTLRDPGDPGKQPTAYNDGLNILCQLEAKRSLNAVGFKNVPPEQDTVRTVVCDSVFSMAKAASNVAKYTTSDLRRVIKIGHLQVHLASGWDTWNAEIGLVEQFVYRLLAIKDIDIILIFHEDDEEAPGSSAEKRSYTGRFEPYPSRYGNIVKYFNEMWRVTRPASGAPQIQVVPSYQFQASTNLGIENVTPDKANIETLIEDYLKRNPQVAKQAQAQSGVLSLQSGKIETTQIKGVV